MLVNAWSQNSALVMQWSDQKTVICNIKRADIKKASNKVTGLGPVDLSGLKFVQSRGDLIAAWGL